MGLSKTELFEPSIIVKAEYFKALSHPARIAILEHLACSSCCFSGDISDFIPLSRTTVSQHLKELKDVGFIKGEIEGTKVNYCLNTEKINLIAPVLHNFLDSLIKNNHNNC